MSKTLTSVSMPFAKITPVEPVNDEFTLPKYTFAHLAKIAT